MESHEGAFSQLEIDMCSSVEDILTNDPILADAVHQCFKSETSLPIIKEELKRKIELRRFEEGKDEMVVKFEQPIKPVLTDEEKRRKEEQKIKNREAAKRYRDREKEKKKQILKELPILQEKNISLKETVQNLECEIFSLQK